MASLPDPLAGAALAYLALATVVALVLPIVAWSVLRVLRVQSAPHRHAVWLCCLVGIAVFPVLRLAGPRVSVAVFRAPPALPAAPSSSSIDPPQLVETAEEPAAVSPAPVQGSDVVPQTQRQSARTRAHVSVRGVVVGLWLAGALAMLARLALATVRPRRLLGRAAGLAETERPELGVPVPARVRVKASGEVGSPACSGLFRPSPA